MNSFKLNSKIELITKDEKKTYGIIHEIIDNKIYVSVPSDDRYFKLLRVGDHIKSIVYDDDKVTGFDATLTKRISGDIPIYELSFIDNFSKVQRREDVRVFSTIPILYTDNKYLLNINDSTVKAKEITININKYLNNGMISDLSAGGLRFSCSKNLNLGEVLLLVFNIADDSIITKGEIVYKELTSSPKKTIYIYGIRFVYITEKLREKIINHNFVMMRKNKLK